MFWKLSLLQRRKMNLLVMKNKHLLVMIKNGGLIAIVSQTGPLVIQFGEMALLYKAH